MKSIDSHYVGPNGSPTVVVFVHGVFGDAESTWKNSRTNAYWPELVENDNDFGKIDVFVASYPTSFFVSPYSINELVEHLHIQFDKHDIFGSHREVIFLCHSMGGLIVRAFLKRYPEYAKKVTLIYFFSTPTEGSDIAKIAKWLSNNRQIPGLMPTDSDDYLEGLNDDWRALPIHIFSKCAYEKQKTDGVMIVTRQSASSLCDGVPEPLDFNHITIVKPETADKDNYFLFKEAFKQRGTPPGESAVSGGTLVAKKAFSSQPIVPSDGGDTLQNNTIERSTKEYSSRPPQPKISVDSTLMDEVKHYKTISRPIIGMALANTQGKHVGARPESPEASTANSPRNSPAQEPVPTKKGVRD